MKSELPSEVHTEITRRCAEGDALARRRLFAAAIDHYAMAWALLPEPKTQWEAATWILAALGDAHFLGGRYDRAEDFFTQAILKAPGGLGNPFLHLRRGECLFETGKKKEAADELMRAYMGAGEAIFLTEKAEYFQHLKTAATL